MHFLLKTQQKTQKKRLLKLKHPDFPPLVIATDNLPYQRDTTPLMASSTSNEQQYPEWVTASSQQNNQTFLFAEHDILFRKMQATSAVD
jgi:hypothetical protein